MFSLLYADSTLVKVSKYAVHSLSRHGSRRKHALFPLNPAIRLGLKSRGREVLCVSSIRLAVHHLEKSVLASVADQAPASPIGERSWIICPCREPHTRNRDSSFHPAPILMQLPGPAGVLPRVCVFWPRLGSTPETVAVHPVGIPGTRRCVWQRAGTRQPLIGDPASAQRESGKTYSSG